MGAEQTEEQEVLVKRFHTALNAANSHKAKPTAVRSFKQSLEDCISGGAKPWLRLKSPLEAARDFALAKAEEMMGPATPEIWKMQAHDLRDELGYKDSPALERALIEHAVLCWLRLAVMELRYTAVAGGSNSFKAVEHTEKRLTEAQKRFNRACETLARVRKMKLPPIQVNIAAEGGRQVNVGAA